MARVCEPPDDLSGGPDDAQDAPRGVVPGGQIALLDGAEGLGRGGVAGQDDEGAAFGEEVHDGFAGEAVDGVVGACAVGGAGVVAEVDVVVVGLGFADLVEDGESAEAGVEDADGGRFIVHFLGELRAVGAESYAAVGRGSCGLATGELGVVIGRGEAGIKRERMPAAHRLAGHPFSDFYFGLHVRLVPIT